MIKLRLTWRMLLLKVVVMFAAAAAAAVARRMTVSPLLKARRLLVCRSDISWGWAFWQLPLSALECLAADVQI
jgi:hypothetical protein